MMEFNTFGLHIFQSILIIYGVAAVAAARFKDWGLCRVVPLVSVLVTIIPSVAWRLPYVGPVVQRFGILGPVISLFLMVVVLNLARNGLRLTERVLRITIVVILFWFGFFMFRPIT